MSQVENVPKLEGMQYRIVKELGTGAGSTIFLISDAKVGDRYALKVVKRQDASDDIYVSQALHEFDVAQKLHHASLLKIYDCRVKRSWFKATSVELLMEYIDGRTLDEIEAPERGQLVLIFIHVASALNHMHRRGVYHGDLKPSNIMLSRQGDVKVLDFGTAWLKGQAKERVQGTPQYMAPEQATERIVDEKTDIYNFGATMYRMFTGHHANLGLPQMGDGGVGLRAKTKPPIAIVPEFPGTLNETIMACLETSPERRPAGVFEIKHQLVAVAKYLGLKPEDLKGCEEDDEEDDEPVPPKPGESPRPQSGDTGFWHSLEVAPSAKSSVDGMALPLYRCGKCEHTWVPQGRGDTRRCPKCQSSRVAKV